MQELFDLQIKQLRHSHFLVLYWVTQAEDRDVRYNITNAFDDLKSLGITRTKQNVMSYIDTLAALCFLEVRDESNRKNLYITTHGARAMKTLLQSRKFSYQPSGFLEGVS